MQLRALFQQFNEQYFGGRLPPYSVRVVHHNSWLGENGFCDEKKRIIKIFSGLSDEEAISTLLHEMTHAANYASHGHHTMPWKRKMISLREAGAPLCGADATVLLDDRGGKTISQDHFRRVVEDMLIDLPGVTLQQAIRGFIFNEGGPEKTITGFLKRYPWAPRVFQGVREDRAKWQQVQKDLKDRLRIK